MSDDKPRRLVAADIIGQQHEAIMAYAQKQPRVASESSSYGTAGTGDKFGLAYLKNLDVVREDGEGLAAYQGRKEAALEWELSMIARINADKLRRDLEASVG